MAKGIEPVIHNWPGSEMQFREDSIFNSIKEATHLLTPDYYDSGECRRMVETKFGPSNFQRFREILNGILT